MKKVLIALSLSLLFILSGCKKEPKPLADGFDEDKLIEEGKKIISYIDEGDKEKIKESGTELFNMVVTDEDLQSAIDLSEEAGDFYEYGPIKVEGFVDFEEKDMGKVKITVAYTEGIIDYLFLFTKDYKVDSIDLK